MLLVVLLPSVGIRMAPAVPAGAIWMCRPVTVTAVENFVETSKSTEPEVMFPPLSRMTCTQTMTFAVDVSVIGGVSLAGSNCVRNGIVWAVSAIAADAQAKSSPVQDKNMVFFIGILPTDLNPYPKAYTPATAGTSIDLTSARMTLSSGNLLIYVHPRHSLEFRIRP